MTHFIPWVVYQSYHPGKYIYICRSKYCVALVKYVGQERYKIVLKVCEKVHDVSGLNPSSGVRKMQLTVDTVNKRA